MAKNVGKGEIASNEQFLLDQQCFERSVLTNSVFKNTCTADKYKHGFV